MDLLENSPVGELIVLLLTAVVTVVAMFYATYVGERSCLQVPGTWNSLSQ
jgi:hypothetical protein